jgi:hypothetical protein
VLVLATDVELGEVALAYAVILDGLGTRGTGEPERIRRELQQYEPGKQAALGVERVELQQEVTKIGAI